MKTLQDYINESILDDEDMLINNTKRSLVGSFKILVETLEKGSKPNQIKKLFDSDDDVRKWTVDRFIFPEKSNIKIIPDVNGYSQISIYEKGSPRLPIISLYYDGKYWVLQIMNREAIYNTTGHNVIKTKKYHHNGLIDELKETFGYKDYQYAWHRYSAVIIK